MRTIPFLVSAAATIGLVTVLNTRWNVGGSETPRLGGFLSPQHGLWQNAAPEDENFSGKLALNGLKGKASVYFDERLVPHVFADQEEDAFYVQGYLHAKFRLWQMEFQTHAAAGRLTEILGVGKDSAILNYDRQMRRLGMVYGAEKTLETMQRDPDTKRVCEAYTAGVNAYITTLRESDIPLEYKLLDYKPEPWTLKKIALFVMYMSYDLSGAEHDFEYTNAKAVFSGADFNKLYPVTQDSLDPIVPKGTTFTSTGPLPVTPLTADSLYFQWKDSVQVSFSRPDKDNGSNNWAVAGTRTASGKPILCNDPHLSLSMPSLWYEIQLHTPGFSANGVSFAGVPSVVIGYNDSCAWGFTNAMRDVRDYYEVKFKDASRSQYWFDSSWRMTQFRIEEHGIAGGGVFRDTVAYTNIGPVMYDARFSGEGRTPQQRNFAVKWKAHDGSNEWRMFYMLNKARNYNDYLQAIQNLGSTGQSCIFASKSGDIALWQQADFPAKWRRQGDFVMPGDDSTFLWQGFIPRIENPHLVNPERGFVSSANQLPVDSSYPYYIGGVHDLYRGKIINRKLSGMYGITPADMQRLQNDNYNLFAETAMPIFRKYLDRSKLSPKEQKFAQIMDAWNLENTAESIGATVFSNWFDSLEQEIWHDEFKQVNGVYTWPEEYTLVEQLLKDSAFSFINNIETPAGETLYDVVTAAFKKAAAQLEVLEKNNTLAWSKFKDTGIRHLLRMEALSRFHLTTGGGRHIINATKQFHGPSWKMVVHLTDETEAYGIYPGGQSGDPSSKYYDNFVDDWAAGKYYKLWMMKQTETADPRVKWTLHFEPAS